MLFQFRLPRDFFSNRKNTNWISRLYIYTYQPHKRIGVRDSYRNSNMNYYVISPKHDVRQIHAKLIKLNQNESTLIGPKSYFVPSQNSYKLKQTFRKYRSLGNGNVFLGKLNIIVLGQYEIFKKCCVDMGWPVN